MKRHEADIKNLVESICLAKIERRKIGESMLVRIIPENCDYYRYNQHPLERELMKCRIPCYVDSNGDGCDEDYLIDLRQLDVSYFADSTNS